MEPIYPAKSYAAVSDLCVITAHFNPCGYQSVKSNYERFRDSLQSAGIHLVTVECAFKDSAFQLEKAEDVLQVRSNSVLWQKERLLNIALDAVREKFSKVAWLDADVLFSNPDWATNASALLNEYEIVQLFEHSAQLASGASIYNGEGQERYSIGFEVATTGVTAVKANPAMHGHTGYAWAARTDALKDGLFDGAIIGGGDHLMAHAMLGDFETPCLDTLFFADNKSRQFYREWAERFYPAVNGRVTYVPGTVLHMWHGSSRNRRYHYRSEKLSRFGIDPAVDLCINTDGCWEWKTKRPSLQKFVEEYFALRQDDSE